MITVKNLTKTYGEKRALNNISFEILQGEICGYIGPNGAGKSTTVKILNGILKPDSGEVTISGADAIEQAHKIRPSIGYVPETGAIFEALTPKEYLLFAGRLHGMKDEIIHERTNHLLKYFGLTAAANQIMVSYSKGMKQKVVIATSLLHTPDVYFFDEPLDGLDAHGTLLFKELLKNLAIRGKTILYCSHLLDIVEKICHRMIVLRSGSIVAHGNIADLRRLTKQQTLEEAFSILTESENVEEKTITLLDNLASIAA